MAKSETTIENGPTVLYKYRDWCLQYHRRILTHNEIHFASPKNLNDPFDIGIEPSFRAFTPEIATRIAEASYRRRGFSEDEKHLRRSHRKCADIRYDEGIQNEYQRWFHDFRDHCFGVLSLTTNPVSRLMWTHYAGGHRGFVIGFKKKAFQELENTRQKSKSRIGLRQVIYLDEYPIAWEQILEDNDQFTQFLLTKHSDLAYEEEWRGLMLPGNEAMATSPLSKEDRTIGLPEDAIESVIFGLSTDTKVKESIISHLADRTPQPELLQIVRGAGWQLEMKSIEFG